MEHRWGQRHSTDVTVNFIAASGVAGTGQLINMSSTGAFMATPVPLRPLSVVYLESPASFIGGESGVRVAASVVRRDSQGVGLEWCEPASAHSSLATSTAIASSVLDSAR